MRGFTIKEMIVVLIVIGLMFAAAVPFYYHLKEAQSDSDQVVVTD